MILDTTLTAAAFATIISAITSAAVTLWITRFNKRKNLDDQLDGLLKISIQYPYLESPKFGAKWTTDFDEDDDKWQRYDLYCILLFNYLERVSKYYNYDKKKIEKYIAIKDWVRQHSHYWQNPTNSYENVDTYDKKFIEIINSYLK